MSIGYAILLFGQMVTAGVQGAFLGMGGLLAVQRDYDGLRWFLKRGLVISCRSDKAYADTSIICEQADISLLVKDDGKPFDPVHVADETGRQY